MTIKKTTPYACEKWHKKNDWEKIKKVTYQKDKLRRLYVFFCKYQ